jgi:hypothetical protein
VDLTMVVQIYEKVSGQQSAVSGLDFSDFQK